MHNESNRSAAEIPYGFCHCGCGQRTRLATQNHTQFGYVKGQPLRFINGHQVRYRVQPIQLTLPFEEKVCTSCHFYKPRTDFGNCRMRKDGLHHECRDCKRESNILYRARHPERKREQVARWRGTAAERVKQTNARWYAANKERHKACSVRRRAANPDWWVAPNNKRRARKNAAEGTYTAQEWRDLKARYEFRCLRCYRQEPDIKLTADHIVPLSKGGTNYIHNIQPLCATCNPSTR